MKILIVRMYPDCLNIKNYNCQEIGLAKAMIKKGNQCDIVLYTDKYKKDEEINVNGIEEKIHIYYLKAFSIFKNCIFEKRLYEIIKNYDVIQTTEYDQIGNIKLKKKAKNKMLIYHGPYESNYTKGYNKKCFLSDMYFKFHPSYKDTICLSKSKIATEFLKKKGFRNVTTVGVGLDVERFEKVGENTEIIKKLIVKKNQNNLKYLLYIGKIEDRRNIIFMISFFKKIIEKNANIRLILVGNGDKKYLNKCFKYAKEEEIFDKIIYFESMKQEELPDLYKNCDVFLLPTKYEIFGMVLLEAIYFGIPVVTTINGGSSVLINNNKIGYICSENNLEEWINAVNEILKTKQQNIVKHKEYITWDDISSKFSEIYKNIIEK